MSSAKAIACGARMCPIACRIDPSAEPALIVGQRGCSVDLSVGGRLVNRAIGNWGDGGFRFGLTAITQGAGRRAYDAFE